MVTMQVRWSDDEVHAVTRLGYILCVRFVCIFTPTLRYIKQKNVFLYQHCKLSLIKDEYASFMCQGDVNFVIEGKPTMYNRVYNLTTKTGNI